MPVKTTMKFDEEDMKIILKEYITENYGVTITGINFKMTTKWQGDQRDGYETAILQGVEIEVEPLKKVGLQYPQGVR